MADLPARDRHYRHLIVADRLSLVGLVFFAMYYLTAFRFDTLFTVESRQVDFTIWRIIPTYILKHARYPAVVTGDWVHTIFPYLPSSAAMMLPLSVPPPAIGFAIWLLIQIAAFALVIWISLRLSGWIDVRGGMLIAIGAVLLSGNSLGWDFRNHNTNIVYLALVLLGIATRRKWLSALMLALSFNLKLYSGALIVVLGWRREYQLAAGTALAALVIAILLPIAVFGSSVFPQLMADWLAQIHYTLSPATQSATTASLFRSAAAALTADPSSQEVVILVRGTQVVWLALVAAYFIVVDRTQPLEPRQYNQARLADVCVALMAPLPLSTWFIPYHAVVMFPAFVLLLVVAVGTGWPNWLRGTAISACLGSQLMRFSLRDYDSRGAMFFVCFVLLLVALAAVRKVLNSYPNTMGLLIVRRSRPNRSKNFKPRLEIKRPN